MDHSHDHAHDHAHHDHAHMLGGFGQGLAAGGGLKNHPGFGLMLLGQRSGPQRLQDHQAVCQGE